MKRILSILLLVASLIVIQACGDDENPVKTLLITSNRSTGTFYFINTKTGELTESFTAMYNDEPLTDIRGFAYHPTLKKIFVSVNSYTNLGDGERNGALFTIDPKSHVATLINDNDGKVNENDVSQSYAIWDAIVNWAITEDDSLIAVGDFNGDGNGFVKFGTNGARGIGTVQADVCCGLGMIYNPETKEALLGNGDNQDNAALDFETFDTETGESLGLVTITDFVNFPDEFNDIVESSWITVKGIASHPKVNNGRIYGLIFNTEDESRRTYFVSIDLENETVTYIATLGFNAGTQYNALSFISSDKL